MQTQNFFKGISLLSTIFFIHFFALEQALATEPLACKNISQAEVASLFNRWNNALKSKNLDSIVANYAEDAVLLPTVSNLPRTNHDEIRNYFIDFIKKNPSGEILKRTIRTGCNWATDTGLYSFQFKDNKDVMARYSFVYEYIDGKWLIVHHHSSIMPEINF
ncbi:MAG: SgcJ/EcaC family oxidoreductase [Gammaproteobacteria bacterium]|nr:SgcJ/EcaC family oxidoreductase [Gammaproteobacteria bacterium]